MPLLKKQKYMLLQTIHAIIKKKQQKYIYVSLQTIHVVATNNSCHY